MCETLMYGMAWAELTNMPMYAMYHIIQDVDAPRILAENKTLVKCLGLAEIFAYLVVRNLVGVYYLFINPLTSWDLYFIVLVIWLASLKWGWGFVKSYKKQNYKQ